MIYPSKVCPCYKPSADEWLGDMPDYWEVRRLRTVVDMRVSNVDKVDPILWTGIEAC